MYSIYKTAYRISDEIKAQKEAEKPFWWDYIHSEVKDKSIEDVEKELLEGDVSPENIAKMSRYEKYLVVSESAYIMQCKDTDNLRAELETLKKDVERSKSSFLNNQNPSQQRVEESFEPIVFGQKPAIQNTIPTGDNLEIGSVPAVQANDGLPPLEPNPKPSFDANDGLPPSNGLTNNDSGFPGAPNSGDSAPKQQQPMSSAEVRKYAQSIVSKTVTEINAKADQIPDDISVMKEQDLFNAVLQEMQSIKNS
jgi:hypothetical protein